MKYLHYTLMLKAPAIVSTLSGNPNSSITQPFIPGSVLRGVLATALLNRGVSDEDFRRFILEGNVRFLHAYPVNGSERSLPVPISWRKEKDHKAAPFCDLSAYTGVIGPEDFIADGEGEVAIEPEYAWPMASLQRAGFPFIEFSGSTRHGVKPRTDARPHQQRDRVKGRSWKSIRDGGEEAHGALFTYEFLQPDQRFHGLIQVMARDNEADVIIEKIKTLLKPLSITIGRSRRAGYGAAAAIEFGSIEGRETVWGDVQQSDIPDQSVFRVYLLSSCIVRDPFTGQLDPCIFPGLLVKRLGGEDTVVVDRILWDFETIGGFNRKWQLEIPQTLAVKAGSVLVFQTKQSIPVNTLRQIEHEGFGERRIEGFGRLVFLQEGQRTVPISLDSPRKEPYPQPTGTAPQLVGFMQQRLLDAAFSRTLDRKVREIVRDVKKVPTGSLLGRLRIPLRHGDPASGLQTLRQWLDDRDSNRRMALKEEAQKKLRDCQLANKVNLRDWLFQTVALKADVEAVIKDIAVPRKYQLGADESLARSVAEAHGPEYAVRLIDAVLAVLARQARRREMETAP